MISEELIKKISDLAKLKIDPKEYIVQLNCIIDLFAILDEVDCSSIEPLVSISESIKQTYREDKVIKSERNAILSNAPLNKLAIDVGCFVVPTVVE